MGSYPERVVVFDSEQGLVWQLAPIFTIVASAGLAAIETWKRDAVGLICPVP